MSTADNLQEAFAGESQANRKYLAFAKKAQADGFKQVARLFRAAAHAETVHALAHFKAMDGIQSTEENLKAAVAGEAAEFREMYPDFVEEAKAEGNKQALRSFKYALAVEEIHHSLYSNALSSVENEEDLPASRIHVCSICGNTVIGELSGPCSVCGASQEKFDEMD